MESFRGTLKSKLVHYSRYRTRQEAIQDITEYIKRSSTTGREGKSGWGISPLRPIRNSSIKRGLQHEPIGVHY